MKKISFISIVFFSISIFSNDGSISSKERLERSDVERFLNNDQIADLRVYLNKPLTVSYIRSEGERTDTSSGDVITTGKVQKTKITIKTSTPGKIIAVDDYDELNEIYVSFDSWCKGTNQDCAYVFRRTDTYGVYRLYFIQNPYKDGTRRDKVSAGRLIKIYPLNFRSSVFLKYNFADERKVIRNNRTSDGHPQ